MTLGWSASEETWLDPVRDLAVGRPAHRPGPRARAATCALAVDSLVVDGDGRATCVVRARAPTRRPRSATCVEVATSPASLPSVVLTVDAAPVGDPAVGPARCVVTGWPAWRLLPLGVGRAGPVGARPRRRPRARPATRSGDARDRIGRGPRVRRRPPAVVRRGCPRTGRSSGAPTARPPPAARPVTVARWTRRRRPALRAGRPGACPTAARPGACRSASVPPTERRGVRPALTGAGDALARNGAGEQRPGGVRRRASAWARSRHPARGGPAPVPRRGRATSAGSTPCCPSRTSRSWRCLTRCWAAGAGRRLRARRSCSAPA